MTSAESTTSPDGAHTATLHFVGEIRFGPPYYSLEIDTHLFDGRLFGESLRWSEDSTMLAIEEWLTTDYARGPITQLTVLDISRRRQCALAKVDQGFIRIKDVDGSVVYITEQCYGTKSEVDRQLRLPLPGEWTWFDEAPRIHGDDS